MSSKWMKMLNKMEGAVDREYDPCAPGNYIQVKSPSINWIYSKCPGLPLGDFLLLWGLPKSGKSVLTNEYIAAVHAMNPTYEVIKFDTEMREAGKIEPFWGIDEDRLTVFNVNEPQLIFDRLSKEVKEMVEGGMPLKLVIIDSLRNIAGVKQMNADSVTNHQMGDKALTIQKGLEAIMPFLRRNRISLICTEHVRGNLDGNAYSSKIKMAGAWHEQHTFEYYVKVTRNNNKAETFQSATGEKFESGVVDFKGNKEVTAHKIFVQMTESSRGVGGRTGQITFNYTEGVVNIEEEIFELAKNLNLVERPNNRTYIANGNSYSSKEEFVTAIKEDNSLRNFLMSKIYNR